MGFADAPVARTREAAIRGELSIMVGASAELFARLEPLLAIWEATSRIAARSAAARWSS